MRRDCRTVDATDHGDAVAGNRRNPQLLVLDLDRVTHDKICRTSNSQQSIRHEPTDAAASDGRRCDRQRANADDRQRLGGPAHTHNDIRRISKCVCIDNIQLCFTTRDVTDQRAGCRLDAVDRDELGIDADFEGGRQSGKRCDVNDINHQVGRSNIRGQHRRSGINSRDFHQFLIVNSQQERCVERTTKQPRF